MSRLIIDVSSEQHQKIKTLAALQGKTMRDYVLDKLFTKTESQSWEELKELLVSRIEEAENTPTADKTFEQLTEEIINKSKV